MWSGINRRMDYILLLINVLRLADIRDFNMWPSLDLLLRIAHVFEYHPRRGVRDSIAEKHVNNR